MIINLKINKTFDRNTNKKKFKPIFFLLEFYVLLLP